MEDYLRARDVFPTAGAPIKMTLAERIAENWWLKIKKKTVPIHVEYCTNINFLHTHFCWRSCRSHKLVSRVD